MRRASLFLRFSCCLLVAAFAPGFGMSAAAQAYPSRPVRIIVPVPAGGGVDSLARLVAQHYNASWGQPFIVDNRPGAGGNIGLQTAARALPDGYTLLVSSSGLVTNAAIRETGYDPVRDFKAISKLSANPYILLTTMTLPVSSVQELIAFAKAKPGQLTYASSGAGGILHLSAELLCAQTGSSMIHVPYKGVADAYPAVVSGHVNWILGSPISALSLMRAGRLKGIAVTSATRSKTLPELPTIAESGVPGYEVTAWFGLFAPSRLPPAITARLYEEAKNAIRNPEAMRRLEAEGTDAVGNSPEEFGPEVARELEKWRRLVERAKLKLG
jgi:tripartite-type tricarboxylate transporter receptor subunit TctC